MNLTQTKRIFLAVDIEPYWQNKIAKINPQLDELDLPQRKLIAQEKLHITIHFWADVNLMQIKKIIECTQKICDEFRAFKIALQDIIAFPSERKPRVLAIKIEQDAMLQALRHQLSDTYTLHGIPVENRAFKPHISIARFLKKIPQENPLLENPFDPEPLFVEELVLFESTLGEHGSVYAPMAKFELR